MTDQSGEPQPFSIDPKPTRQRRLPAPLGILLIGGLSMLLIVLMCAIVAMVAFLRQ